jgi:hypothetical protein
MCYNYAYNQASYKFENPFRSFEAGKHERWKNLLIECTCCIPGLGSHMDWGLLKKLLRELLQRCSPGFMTPGDSNGVLKNEPYVSHLNSALSNQMHKHNAVHRSYVITEENSLWDKHETHLNPF